MRLPFLLNRCFSFKPRGIHLFYHQNVLFLLWLFLLVFPKGGFKVSDIPITWGYILLSICTLLMAFQKTWYVQEKRALVLCSLFPFQLVALSTLFFNGIADVGMGISFLTNFFFLPFIFFLLFSNVIDTMNLEVFCSLIKKGVFFVSIYGILLFFFKLATGRFLEIPFLTVNWGDLGALEGKHINRGSIFKLISTYNNGNIFGICILFLTPLFNLLEKKSWRKWIVKLSLVLTLSRTVWIGLIFSEIFIHLLLNNKRKTKNILNGLMIAIVLIGISAYFFSFSSAFFLDETLGGRVAYLDILQNFHLFSDLAFSGILEIVYLGMLNQFGLVGLLAFLLAIGSPLLLIIGKYKNLGPIRAALLCGLATYLLIACSDGALLYIPTMVFYWFCSSLILRKDLECQTTREIVG